MAGGTARIATDICQHDPKQIDAYKERARHAFAAEENFEGDWILGWNNQQNAVDDISKVKMNSPDECELQKSETCARIRGELNPYSLRQLLNSVRLIRT
ncbi:hypothetical protein [Phyllobacterium sp. P5_D12]